MRNEAQRTLEYQNMLPADTALWGFKNISADVFMAALRAWEKRRGIVPMFVKSAAKMAPTLPRKTKQTREEKLARKRETARKRWAAMTPEQKAAETARINRWRNEKRNNKQK